MNKILRVLPGLFSLAALSLVSFNALSSVVISGTRVIYPADAREVTVKVSNVGKSPVLIQSWIDKGEADAKPDNIQVPFILTPPMNRVEPNKGQTLRISAPAVYLPTDRETVFWLNVLEIPAKKQANAGENLLQMAFRSRIKLFYRPAGLQGNANDAAKAVSWKKIAGGVSAINPTPYYVSLVTVSANGKSVEGEMIAPKSSMTFNIPATAGGKIIAEYVNDYGAVNKVETEVK